MIINTIVGKETFELFPSDIHSYKSRPITSKKQARTKLKHKLEHPKLGRNQVTVLPEYLVLEIWNNCKHKGLELITWPCYDGGVYFRIERKTPCKLIHDE